MYPLTIFSSWALLSAKIIIELYLKIPSLLSDKGGIHNLSSTPAKNHAKCDSWVKSLHIFIFYILFEMP